MGLRAGLDRCGKYRPRQGFVFVPALNSALNLIEGFVLVLFYFCFSFVLVLFYFCFIFVLVLF